MNTEKPTVTQAKEALGAIRESQHALNQEVTPPAWISLFNGLSLGLIIFGYGMTEHENQWALAMWLGGIGFIISCALYVYSFRLKGVKKAWWPKSKASNRINIYTAVAFAALTSSSRILRTDMGIELAPLVCGVVAAGLVFWLQRKYPTGEVGSAES